MCQDRAWLANHPPAAEQEELTENEWRRVIDQMTPFSVVSFTGGEPSLHPDFLALLAYASQRRRTHVMTNAASFSPRDLDGFVDMAAARVGGKGLNAVGISLHGDAPVHNMLTATPDSFEKALSVIRDLAWRRRQAGKSTPLIHVTAVVMQENIGTLAKLPALLREAGADILNLTRKVEPFDLDSIQGKEPWAFVPDDFALPLIPPAMLDDALNAVEDAAREVGLPLRLPDMPRKELLAYYDGGLTCGRHECTAPWWMLLVGADGRAYPCLLHAVGDVRTQRLRDIWNGSRMRMLRRQVRRQIFPMCQGCCFLRYRGRWDDVREGVD